MLTTSTEGQKSYHAKIQISISRLNVKNNIMLRLIMVKIAKYRAKINAKSKCPNQNAEINAQIKMLISMPKSQTFENYKLTLS